VRRRKQIGVIWKQIFKLATPPFLVQLAKSAGRLIYNQSADIFGLSGDYHNWDEALAASKGYASEIILEKTKSALLRVKNGEAVYERDSVLFDEIKYSWPVLAGLMWVAAGNGGRLNVLDLGGSLGSTYFQNRKFLQALPEVRWNIIEQAGHVETGKIWFEDDYLRFYAEIADCLEDTQPNVVLLSGILQYLENPHKVFNQIMALSSNHIIIDRTPFWDGPKDRLCVQKVPPSIYAVSYPCWIFSRPQFDAFLNETWQIITDFSSVESLEAPVKTVWLGLVLERKKQGK
jgi:putative methyltransferase (TIGR04325 family)